MEIYGIGTDIIEISRIEKEIKQTSLFKRKVYTEKEIAKSLNIASHNVNILKEKALNKLSIDLMRNDFVENNEETNYIVN